LAPPERPTRPLRIGVLGAAAIAPNAIVKPAQKTPRAQVVAIAAREEPRARAFATRHGVPVVHRTYLDLIDDPDIDAVYNPLPNGLHGNWTMAAVRAGKHVLCEKPFTANADEARTVAAAVEDSDRVVMEAFHWRYHPMARRLLEVVGNGELGQLQQVEASFCFPLLRRHDIRWDWQLAGGALMDAGCYAVHMVRTVAAAGGAGEPRVIDARAAKISEGRVDRALSGRLQFDAGPTAMVSCSLLSRRVLALHLRAVGDRGDLRARNLLMPKLFGSMRVRAGGRQRVETPPRTETYDCQLEAFVAAVTEGTPFPTDVDDAVGNMVMIDDLYRAAGMSPRHPTPVPDLTLPEW
jgi:predicted dehydrogenase